MFLVACHRAAHKHGLLHRWATSDMAALVTERVLQTRGWWGVDRWVGAVYSSVPEAALAPLLATW